MAPSKIIHNCLHGILAAPKSFRDAVVSINAATVKRSYLPYALIGKFMPMMFDTLSGILRMNRKWRSVLSGHVFHIFLMRAKKKMIGITAGGVVASVTDTHSLGYLAVGNLPHETVCSSSRCDVTIFSMPDPDPGPACVISAALVDLAPKIINLILRKLHEFIPFVGRVRPGNGGHKHAPTRSVASRLLYLYHQTEMRST